MKVWLLWHHDGQDYYVTTETLVGIYTNKEKAVEAYKKTRVADFQWQDGKPWAEGLFGKLLGDRSEMSLSSLYFWIEEREAE